MLRDEPWIRIGKDILAEYEQGILEGKDVEKYAPLCRKLAEMETDDLLPLERMLCELQEKMENAPLRADYPFTEPSDYESIVKESTGKGKNPPLPPCPDRRILESRIRGGWLGRMSGCLLGKPVEGYHRDIFYPLLRDSGNFPMNRYMRLSEFSAAAREKYGLERGRFWADLVKDASFADDDTNYTVLGLKILETYGRDFTPDDVMQGWLRWLPYLSCCTAERAAYRNGAAGLLPPETATFRNPYREWIGALIRADFYGYVNPGDPVTAAEMAFRDASVSHVKNGIYGSMFVAAMTAAALVTDDVNTVLDAGLAVIPEHSRMYRDVTQVRAWYAEGLRAEEIMERIHGTYDECSGTGWCYTNSNAMIDTMALLCGGGDYGRSICLAVQTAFDTDCNGATVGSLLGIMNGAEHIPEKWIAPFGGRLYTAIEGYPLVDADQLTEKTLALLPTGK